MAKNETSNLKEGKNNPEQKKDFSFNISLSVLNHLGRNLYRSFVTVLGEAISNAWDADAKNVWIYIDRDKNTFTIKDDGDGMNANDFQEKFLKIGYSKRADGKYKSARGRPFIGRKGIGKLALLSCAKRISIITKTASTAYIGGVIDNSGLDKAITRDLTPEEYPLESVSVEVFKKYTLDHTKGTIIHFDELKGGIRNSLNLLRKVVALYFRFSLIDKSFNIFIDGKKVDPIDLKDLSDKTEFLWTLNELKDPFVDSLKMLKEKRKLTPKMAVKGFIATVERPRDLTIQSLEERVTVDLFVNGRLREKNILRHIPTARIVEDYLYGQVHFDELDEDDKDRFTSDREGVVAEDTTYQLFLKNLKEVMKTITDDWDKWRRKHRKDGDSENPSITPKERKSGELFNVISLEFSPPKGAKNKGKIDGWVDELEKDAQYNFTSYAECFIAENLVRNYIKEKNIPMSPEANKEISRWKKSGKEAKGKANLSIEIRRVKDDASYLSMGDLAALVDKKGNDPFKDAHLVRDANEYKPMRDAVAHTSLLSDNAKRRLNLVYENIKGRINTLLTGL